MLGTHPAKKTMGKSSTSISIEKLEVLTDVVLDFPKAASLALTRIEPREEKRSALLDRIIALESQGGSTTKAEAVSLVETLGKVQLGLEIHWHALKSPIPSSCRKSKKGERETAVSVFWLKFAANISSSRNRTSYPI